MKRFVVPFLALVILCASMPVSAGKWVTREIKWQLSNQGGPLGATAIWVRDTTHAVFGGAAVDTTNEFSLDEAFPLLRGVVAGTATGSLNSTTASGSDTLTMAYMLFQTDSSAAGTSSAATSSLPVFIDGRLGGMGSAVALSNGWVKADSLVLTASQLATNTTLVIPIKNIGAYGNILAYPQLRLRTVANVGYLSAARVFLRYWKEN